MLLNTFLTDISPDAGYFQIDCITDDVILINEIIVGKCVVDKLYINQSTDVYVKDWNGVNPPTIEDWDGSIPENWEWDTIMNANFDGNLAAGSVEFSAQVVSELRLKRRKKGSNIWKTINSRDVNEVADFKFDYYDKLAAGNMAYEYALVPVISGEEGAISSSEVKSEFSDYYLFDDENYYHVVIDSMNTPTYNIEGASQTTIAQKYPYIIRNGYVGYYSGTLEAVFIPLNNCKFDVENGAFYRQEIDKFLANGKAKILKDWQGNIYMVSIFESISQDTGEGAYYPRHSINWTECGDATNVGDLFDNNFINTDVDRE